MATPVWDGTPEATNVTAQSDLVVILQTTVGQIALVEDLLEEVAAMADSEPLLEKDFCPSFP